MTISKNYIMSSAKLFGLMLFIASAFTSCKKDKAEAPATASTIEGSWIGKRGDGNSTPDYDFRFAIKTGGVIEALNSSGAVKGSGTWTLNGTEFAAQYQFVAPLFTKYQVKGTYDKSGGKLTGVWGFDDGLFDEGTWYLDKQQ